MTLPEVLLWRELRRDRLNLRFRRQHPIGTYIADFCCVPARLVVEVDGEVHGHRERRDRERDAFITGNGYRVLRIAAVDVLNDIAAVVTTIRSCVARPLHHASHGPPPRNGEE